MWHWYRWKFTRSVVLDGNFSAQHRKMRRPEDDVALADGHAFMVTDAPYKEHLKTAAEFREVCWQAQSWRDIAYSWYYFIAVLRKRLVTTTGLS